MHFLKIGTETTSEAMQVVESEGDFFLSTPPITLASSSNPAEIGSVTDDNDHTGDTPSNIKKRKRQDEKEPIVANGNDVAKSEEAAAESTSGSAPFVISDDDILMFDQSSSSASKRIKTKESDNDNGNGNQIPTDIGRVQEKGILQSISGLLGKTIAYLIRLLLSLCSWRRTANRNDRSAADSSVPPNATN